VRPHPPRLMPGAFCKSNCDPSCSLPRPATGINLSNPELSEDVAGGTQITLQSVIFAGNTRLTQAQLQAVLAGAMGKSLDLEDSKPLPTKSLNTTVVRATRLPVPMLRHRRCKGVSSQWNCASM
jgi:hypothetical protein